jgi:hypothetical protein
MRKDGAFTGRVPIRPRHTATPLAHTTTRFWPPGGELRIDHRRLPIAAAMRLQAGLGQDPAIGRIVNCTPDSPFYDHLLQKETGKGPLSCLLTSPGPLFYTTESS